MKNARKQIRLSIPISDADDKMVKRLLKDKVDGVTNKTQLVRRLLEDRFKRYLAEKKPAAKQRALTKKPRPAKIAPPVGDIRNAVPSV